MTELVAAVVFYFGMFENDFVSDLVEYRCPFVPVLVLLFYATLVSVIKNLTSAELSCKPFFLLFFS